MHLPVPRVGATVATTPDMLRLVRRHYPAFALALAVATVTGFACTVDEDIEDAANASFGPQHSDGKADGPGLSPAQVRGVLSLVNDPAIDATDLRGGARITARVANNIVNQRNGSDGQPGTADDDRFDTLEELDAVPYVGPATLAALLSYAAERGLVTDTRVEVIFSPQAPGATHTSKIAQLIRSAQHSIDIAMYSYSDADVAAALTDAIARGVKVRFLFETAGEDKKLELAARGATKSGRLEAAGIDVRYVNKILHHKFVIIDGPRDEASRAASGTVVTGSGNWSYGGSQVYDESTLFIYAAPAINLGYQAEFNKLWEHSRDFALATPLPYETSAYRIDASRIVTDPELSAHFTSANFVAGGADGATWRQDGNEMVMADEWVKAIAGAQRSIHIASGHFRLRPVAEALLAKKRAQPDIDIKVYLDQQEYISVSGLRDQMLKVDTCLATATTEAKRLACTMREYLFSRDLANGGIDVRIKAYAYRWDNAYAAQMHNKYMIVDGNTLIAGSYNLSVNAEHDTFENAVRITGSSYAATVTAYERDFTRLWNQGGTAALDELKQQIATAPTIPLVWKPLALTLDQFTDVKNAVRAACPAADSAAFRTNPGAHRTCTR